MSSSRIPRRRRNLRSRRSLSFLVLLFLVRVYRAECLFQRPHADYLNAVVFAAAERREALFRDYAPLKSEPRAFLDALPDVGSRTYLSAEPDLSEHHQFFRYHLVA